MGHITGRSQGQGHPVRVENVGELLLPNPPPVLKLDTNYAHPTGSVVKSSVHCAKVEGFGGGGCKVLLQGRAQSWS